MLINPVLVYSIMETIVMSRAKRLDQIDTIKEDIESKGIKNAVCRWRIQYIIEQRLRDNS